MLAAGGCSLLQVVFEGDICVLLFSEDTACFQHYSISEIPCTHTGY